MSLLLVLLVCVLTCCGQLCQKQAVECWKSATPLTVRRKKAFGWLVLAVGALGLALLFWLWALQSLPLGVAYPMLSFNFVLMALAAHCFFHETLSHRHVVGIACIALGVVLLGISL